MNNLAQFTHKAGLLEFPGQWAHHKSTLLDSARNGPSLHRVISVCPEVGKRPDAVCLCRRAQNGGGPWNILR